MTSRPCEGLEAAVSGVLAFSSVLCWGCLSRGAEAGGDGCSLRAANGCNAWFWCKEAAGCWEPQSGEAVGFRECILLGVAMQPQPLPPPGPPSRDEFSSFAAGYLVDEGSLLSRARMPLRS